MALSRRDLLASAGGASLGAALPGRLSWAGGEDQLTRVIPSSGQELPVIGMGSWITFNVGDDEALRDERAEVLQRFFDLGGAMVDSSPMYGTAQEVIGYCLDHTVNNENLFSATKVWTLLQSDGPAQMAEARQLWGVDNFDLIQVHNLVNWEGHMETLLEDRARGKLKYIGITTSHGRRHEEFEEILESQPIDFIQLTYNIMHRQAEQRLLPLAAERGVAVVANRPFQGGTLFEMFGDQPLPEWAGEFGAENWAQFFLKFIVSHPAITCAIPATSRVDHMDENMGALYGVLPDAATRQRMIDYVESLSI